MSSIKKQQTMLNIFQIIQNFSKIVGLTAFSIKKESHQNHKAYLSFLDVLCAILATSWNFFIILKYKFSADLWEAKHEYVSEFIESFSIIAVTINIAIVVFITWWLQLIKSKFAIILNLMSEVDDLLSELEVTVDYLRHKKALLIAILVMTTFNILSSFADYFSSNVIDTQAEPLFLTLVHFFSTQFFILLWMQFLLFMVIVETRFNTLNKALIKMPLKLNANSATITKTASLKIVAKAYDKLIDAVDQLNYFYGLPVS